MIRDVIRTDVVVVVRCRDGGMGDMGNGRWSRVMMKRLGIRDREVGGEAQRV